MTIGINFSNIREHDGSKQNGFEELVCQIAHIEKPVGAKKFIRKEGSGGDAGVECFWTLDDGREYGWQAKYFTEPLTSSQWSQIHKSVKTALNKHQNLTHYYVCVPRDRTDSKQERNGKLVKSALDYWDEYVKKWTRLATEKGMHVEFEYWGKHELTMYLQQDKPEYTGKILYWFDAAVVSSASLLRLAEDSRVCLGERFTPEYHVELPIAKSFSCIGCDDNWRNSIRTILSNVYDLSKEINQVKMYSLLNDKSELCCQLVDEYKQFLDTVFEFENDNLILFEYLENLEKMAIRLIDICNELSNHLYEKYSSNKELKDEYRNENSNLLKIRNSLSTLEDFFAAKDLKAGKEKELLVTGTAGSGKSHLLCDISMKRLEHNFPTVFLLGQHYAGGNPIRFIAEKLNLANRSDLEVLGALDTLGETYKCRTLIIIDAINEGSFREDWYNHLKMFLQQCKAYNNLAVVISCRSTYVEYIIPEDVLKTIPKINHEGFKGYERRAALKYLGNQGVSLPSVPFFSPEFSNPLFLKTTCKAIKNMELKEFPKGLNGFNQVFEFYLDSLEKIIKQKKSTHSNQFVHNAVEALIKKIYPDNLWGIPSYEAEQTINACDYTKNDTQSLFELLIFEGLISLDVIEDRKGKKKEVIRFTYERFSDYALANHILNRCNTERKLCKLFANGGEIFKLLKKENRYANVGIIQALGIEIPEKFHKEFIEYINPVKKRWYNTFFKFLIPIFNHRYNKLEDDNKWQYDWYLENTFKEGILSRTANSITKKSLELLNELRGYPYHMPAMDILVSLSTEPNHPWNADFLDKNLRRRSLAERDLFWSTYVAVNDYHEDEDQPESPIRTLLNWVLDNQIDKADKERLRLTAITILWLTTTSNREVRQQATKALSKVLYYIPEKIATFIEQYNDIDDSYLVTSLYGAAYGAIVNIRDKELVKEITNLVIKKQFSVELEHPHILIRDYARGIIEYAYSLGGIIDKIKQYRPPYTSKWPLENPLPSEIDAIDEKYSEIKNSVQGFISDFGKYVMKDVDYWTATPLSKKVAESGKELQYRFAETLPEDLKSRYIEILDRKIKVEEEKNRNFDLESFLDELTSDDITIDSENNIDSVNEKEEIENNLVYDTEDEDLDFMPPTMIEKTEEELIKEIKLRLGEAEQEYFRWVRKQGVLDHPAKFSHNWACRWVIKRAYELGWTKALFSDFERMYCRNEYGQRKGVVERIGKKYQWIAYYELLARLADNLIFGDRGYSDVDDSKFYGPWQIDIREMDPTYWGKAKPEHFYHDNEIRWWRPYQFGIKLNDLDEQIKWLWDTSTLPDLQSIICTKNNETQEEWLVLHSFCDWTTRAIKDKSKLGEPNLWYRINTCVIKQEDLGVMKESMVNQPLCSPDIIFIPNSNNQRFLGEYPWHPCYVSLEEWIVPEDWHEVKIPCVYHVPLFEYEWSTRGFSHMPDESSRFYMPSKKIVKEMHLYKDISKPSYWYNGNNVVFMDPSIQIDTQPCALINKEVFCKWLSENNYVLVWLIGGEKQLFTHDIGKFYGRLVYSALYSMDGSGNIIGENWTEKELPNSRG